MEKAQALLEKNRPHLDAVVQALLEKNRLYRTDLQEILPPISESKEERKG
jgi:ATP-dependent Zn protease